MTNFTNDVIGLVPMAGQATRLAPLPGSKELLPLGFQERDQGGVYPKVISAYLLETMRRAAITRVMLVLRQGKLDIANYYAGGAALGLELAYSFMKQPYGVPYTLDSAFAFVRNSYVAVGFPDIIYEPKDAFVKLRQRLETSTADVILGLFPASAPSRSDMVETAPSGELHTILIKPAQTDLTLSWGLALWAPSFTAFMHNYLARLEASQGTPEVQLSTLLLEAKKAGLSIDTLSFPAGGFWDVGTPEGYRVALERFG